MSNESPDTFTSVASQTVAALAPLVSIAFPNTSLAIAAGVKIIQGVLAAEPSAVALFNQISNGTPATLDQLQAHFEDFDTADDQLAADIKAQLGMS